MASLANLRVLVVDDDADNLELLQEIIEAQGAAVTTAGSAADALRQVLHIRPDVLVTDISLPDEDGYRLLARVRAEAATSTLPAIAVTGHSDEAARQAAMAAGFQKFIVKPFDIFTLTTSIASCAGAGPKSEPPASLADLVERRDMRALLRTLNTPTPYRFTSILRFRGTMLQSVWTYDRERDACDEFPSDTPIAASYCTFIQRSPEPFVVTDASADDRTEGHAKRETLRAYCGVPLLRSDGSLFGSLCHFDERPQERSETTVTQLQVAAKLLTPQLTSEALSNLEK